MSRRSAPTPVGRNARARRGRGRLGCHLEVGLRKVPRSRSHGRTPPPPSVHQRLSKLRNFGLTLHAQGRRRSLRSGRETKAYHAAFFNSRRIGLSSPASRSAASSDNSGWWATRASADLPIAEGIETLGPGSRRLELGALLSGGPSRLRVQQARRIPRTNEWAREDRVGLDPAGGGLAQPLGSARLRPR